MVANKLMRGDTNLPVAHHRSEADVVEEVCGRTEPTHQMSVINSHSHHRQLSLPQTTTQAKSWRSDATIILLGWEHHTGGSKHPQYTRALFGGEAVGGSSQQHSTKQNEPKL